VWTNGTLSLYFYIYASKPPFDDEDKRLAILERINAIPGIALSRDAIGKSPTVPLKSLVPPS
jgi:hypothetical protein